MNTRRPRILSALVLLATGACVGPPDSTAGDRGGVTASLQLSPTTMLNTASYSITGPNAFARAGTIDVSHSETIAVTIGGIPAGIGYNASITGTATDGVTSCSGSAMFSVTAKMTTALMITIQCREPAKNGNVQIDGRVNVCPVVDGMGANPGEVMVGLSSGLIVSAHYTDNQPVPLTAPWQPPSCILASVTTATPTSRST